MPHKTASACLAYVAQSALLSVAQGAALPEWLHLLPAGELRLNQERGTIRPLKPGTVPQLCTFDGRDPVDRAPVDVNHANSKRGGNGEDTPAYGWLVELAARTDGLWGRVEWNERGLAAIKNREYRGVSAELMVRDGEIVGIRGASLTNHPNVKGLTPVFNSTEEDDPMDKILKELQRVLELKDDATPEAVLQSVTALVTGNTALTGQLAAIAKAAGAAADAKPEAVLQSVTALVTAKTAAATDSNAVVTNLQAELQSVTAQLNTLQQSTARDKATAFVDGAIKEGRVGVKPLRDHYIARHMAAAADVEKEISAMPMLSGTTVLTEPPTAGSLSPQELHVARLMNVSPDDMKKIKAAELAAANG